jgi:hypothetical protein
MRRTIITTKGNMGNDSVILTKHGEEIAALREGHKTLESALTQLTQNVTDMGRNLSTQIEGNREATHRELAGIKDSVASIGKPNYGTIFTGVALCVTMGIAVMTPIWQGIGNVKTELKEVRSEFTEHEKLPIHPVAKQRIDDMEHEIELKTAFRADQIARIERELNEKISSLRQELILRDELDSANGKVSR